jgi:hypothetical protein
VIATIAQLRGESDPDCLSAMGNLAGVLWRDGEFDEAYELQRQVVEHCRSSLGDGDPATRAAQAVLESMERGGGF